MRLADTIQGVCVAALCGVAIACGSSSPSGAKSAPPDSGTASTPRAMAGGYNVCARLDDAVDCFACCASYFPLGQQKLLNAAASCACTAPYCGPLSSVVAPPDAGGDSAAEGVDADGTDASEGGEGGQDAPETGTALATRSDADTGFPFGQGSCSADMCSLQVAPSQLCVKCTLGILEGSEGPPLCPDSMAACKADPDCAQLLTCAVFCPAAVPD
jgi:hypothetical protein